MAALLPKSGESAKVVTVGGGKLGLEIDGTIIKDRNDRMTFLKSHAGVSVFDAKLDDLLPKPSKKIRDGIKQAQLVLITSQASVAPLSSAPAGAVASEVPGLSVFVRKTEHAKCVRCWQHRADIGQFVQHPELCGRCVENVDGQGEVRRYA